MDKLQYEKKERDAEDVSVVDAELVGEVNNSEIAAAVIPRRSLSKMDEAIANDSQKHYLFYFLLPFIFLTVALLGGLRLSDADNSFIFLKPALFCLIFASVMLVLFFRTGLIRLDGWFSENFGITKNVSNAGVLLTLFAGNVQLFNSLLPEQGLPFWIVAFCFSWTLWNNLFADFDTKK
ncbi:MAG: hypothetical protein H7070_14210, partial [Saprospiraceae bacterium]|nr:hypothetical protein [Pyrinomonadaceae bacterium]